MKKSLIAFAALAAALCAGAAHAFGISMVDVQAAAGSLMRPEVALGLAGLGAAGITTYVQNGEILDLTPSANVSKGVGYMFGAGLFGVAVDDVTSGSEGRFITEGVVTIAKTSALAIAVGDRVFWDSTNSVVNKTTTAQVCVGIAVEAAANPSSTVKIKLGRYLPAAT